MMGLSAFIKQEELLYQAPSATIKDPWGVFSMRISFLENLLAEGWKLRMGLR
jgi:hypothetical protein